MSLPENMYSPRYLSAEDRDLVAAIGRMLHDRQHQEGIARIRARLEQDQPTERNARAEFLFFFGGFLIDFGGDMESPDLVEEGVQLLGLGRTEIATLLGAHTLEYCFGNAKHGLYGQKVRANGLPFKPENLGLLVEAKNHYWRALKSLEEGSEQPWLELCVNIGNVLDTSGRVIEAIRWYDRALELDDQFGMAHLNRAIALDTLRRYSDTFTVNMLLQQERHFKRALADPTLPEQYREEASSRLERVRHILRQDEVVAAREAESLEAHEHHLATESEDATPFRQFCIENKLALNEHALYCTCIGAQSDNLRIPKTTAPIGGEFVPGMELLLNRMRAEFGLARMLYYEYLMDDPAVEEFEPEYSELFDNEKVGLRTEKLRTSFRLCSGILDRIAFAVCLLFDLAGKKELIYFESFWKKRQPSEHEKARWEKINEAKNWGLTALYSLATDLNTARGEWRHYKHLRNRLEHEALLLTEDESLDLGPWIEKTAGERLESVSISTFEREALQLLQFTAAAIFYFTFCVRQEGIKARKKGGVAVPIDKRVRDSD